MYEFRPFNSQLINIHINLDSINFHLINLELYESRFIIHEFIHIHVFKNFNGCLNLCINNYIL